MRKTHLWISLIVGVLVWGAYFAHFLNVMRDGHLFPMILSFLGALATVVVAEVVATGLIGWLFRRRMRALDDGPTLNAALKASHVSLMAVMVMMMAAAGALVLAAGFGWRPDIFFERQGFARLAVIAANALLALVVIAELLRAALTLALLPRR
ncbi:hypothetical protein [Brevundimonas sp. FT23028]|uniref:hypothetical protein n=1 Tax=Brevundimonas sp. FT23028 TaxID=3393748 RepID=UPI003B58AB68